MSRGQNHGSQVLAWPCVGGPVWHRRSHSASLSFANRVGLDDRSTSKRLSHAPPSAQQQRQRSPRFLGGAQGQSSRVSAKPPWHRGASGPISPRSCSAAAPGSTLETNQGRHLQGRPGTFLSGPEAGHVLGPSVTPSAEPRKPFTFHGNRRPREGAGTHLQLGKATGQESRVLRAGRLN